MNNNCKPYTRFKHAENISDDFLLNILEINMKLFFDWSFLCIGAWFDADINDKNMYGVNQHSALVPVSDHSYDSGQVWQSIRKDWVWETGVLFNDTNPTPITGIYIDDVYYPNNQSTYTINYPEGRIILDSAKSTTSNIKLNYSYRNIQTYRASDSPWFNVLQYNSFDTSSPDITRTEDGDWSISGNHRVQLPAIIIEAVARSRSYPYELGNNDIVINQDIEFYVLAETKNERNKILDILRLQQDLVFLLYDTNTLSQNDQYPLDHNGNLKSNPQMYPGIVDNYTWRKAWIKEISLFELESVNPNFHMGMAKATIEIIS
jgi:hypothetical protein